MFLVIATTYCCNPTEVAIYSINTDTFLSLIPFKNCDISDLNSTDSAMFELIQTKHKPIDTDIMPFCYDQHDVVEYVYCKYNEDETVCVIKTTCG